MEKGAAEKVMGVSLTINIFAISFLLLAFFPMAIIMILFFVSLGTDELITLEGGELPALQLLLLLLTLITLFFCLIVTVGSRIYLDSLKKGGKEKEAGRARSYVLVWAAALTLVTALVLLITGIAGSLDQFEGLALWIIFMTGMMFISIGYGLASLHLSHFGSEIWVGRMKGLARLPPALLLLGFPAVSMLAVLDDFPFLSVLLVFCNCVLIASLAVTLIVNGRTLYAIRRSGARPV